MKFSQKRSSKGRKTSTIAGLSVAILALAPTGADASYFSKGWIPGQPTAKVSRPPATFDPDVHPAAAEAGGWKLADIANVAGKGHESSDTNDKEAPAAGTDRPSFSLVNVFSDRVMRHTGFNISGVLEKANAEESYSRVNDTIEGFTRLTDDNYEEEVVYEQFPLTGGVGEDDRVWFMMIHGPPRDMTTKLYMEAMTNASIATKEAGDLPNVKWGRIDFLTENTLVTRWLIFRPPYFVFATNRGQDVRFLPVRAIVPSGDVLRQFLQEEAWKTELPVWQSEWARGGNKAWLIDSYITFNNWYGKVTAKIPSWMMMIIMGLVSQTLLRWLHKETPADKERKEKEKAALEVTAKKLAVKQGLAKMKEKGLIAEEEKKAEAASSKGKGKNEKSTPKKKGGKAATSSSKKTGKDGVEVTIEKKKI